MDEEDWLACAEPAKMLEFVKEKASDRKFRLFGCSCCRRIWHLIADPRSRQAVEASERFAEGTLSETELHLAQQQAHEASEAIRLAWAFAAAKVALPPRWWETMPESAVTAMLSGNSILNELELWEEVAEIAGDTSWATASETIDVAGEALPVGSAQYYAAFKEAKGKERLTQVGILRHIFGNPFQPYPAPAHWPSTVVQLAASLYYGHDCSFALHDALLEVGHPELAKHFQEKDHPKGCWALDVILGKE